MGVDTIVIFYENRDIKKLSDFELEDLLYYIDILDKFFFGKRFHYIEDFCEDGIRCYITNRDELKKLIKNFLLEIFLYWDDKINEYKNLLSKVLNFSGRVKMKKNNEVIEFSLDREIDEDLVKYISEPLFDYILDRFLPPDEIIRTYPAELLPDNIDNKEIPLNSLSLYKMRRKVMEELIKRYEDIED